MEKVDLIHFFGPDGSGKTTQVDLLMSYFKQRGIPARKIWVRSPHTLAYCLWRVFTKIGFYRIIWNAFGIGIKIPAVHRNRLVKNFWCLLEFISVLPHVLRINFLISSGYVLIAERYLLDTITTAAFFVNDINFLKNPLASILIRFIPKKTMFIFIDADFDAILKRRTPLFIGRMQELQNANCSKKTRQVYGYVPNSVVEPQEFIDFQRRAYKSLAKSVSATEIFSPNHSIDDMFRMILQLLGLDQ